MTLATCHIELDRCSSRARDRPASSSSRRDRTGCFCKSCTTPSGTANCAGTDGANTDDVTAFRLTQPDARGGQDRLLTRCLKPDLLITDDMGTKQLPHKSGEFLFEIIVRWQPRGLSAVAFRVSANVHSPAIHARYLAVALDARACRNASMAWNQRQTEGCHRRDRVRLRAVMTAQRAPPRCRSDIALVALLAFWMKFSCSRLYRLAELTHACSDKLTHYLERRMGGVALVLLFQVVVSIFK